MDKNKLGQINKLKEQAAAIKDEILNKKLALDKIRQQIVQIKQQQEGKSVDEKV